MSGKASIWQWTDNYKGLNVDGSVVLEDLNSEETTKEIREEDLDMGMYVMRSKSGKLDMLVSLMVFHLVLTTGVQ